MSVRANETLEQFGERVAAAVRRRFMDTLDDDVIVRIGKSHVIFGQACAMEAVETAMRESMAAHINDGAGMGELPEVMPGHWTTPGGRDMALATLDDPHMARSRERISDFALANEVFLSPGIANLTDAKERIRWLSARLALGACSPAEVTSPVAAVERLKRARPCGGDDCTEYDHGVDEGIDLALAEVRKAAPADASGEVEPSSLLSGLQDVWEEIERLNERCFGAGSEASVSVRTSDLTEVIDVIRDNLPRNPAAGL